jgi:hypothetical protein
MSIAIGLMVLGGLAIFFVAVLLVAGLTAVGSAASAAAARMADRGRPANSPAPGLVVCLRPTWQLSADTAEALVNVVNARIRTAAPSLCAVVLDLSATSAVDDGVRAALQPLHALLAQNHVDLRLALSGPRACVQSSGDGTEDAIGVDALHTSVRAAMLAVYATLPGPALVTTVMRGLLTQQPEPLLLPAGLPRPAAVDRTPVASFTLTG